MLSFLFNPTVLCMSVIFFIPHNPCYVTHENAGQGKLLSLNRSCQGEARVTKLLSSGCITNTNIYLSRFCRTRTYKYIMHKSTV